MVHGQRPRAELRLLAGCAVAPPCAALIALAAADALWYSGLLSGGVPINTIDAAVAVGLAVGILAVVMTVFAVPLVMWLNGRGPLSLRKILVVGAVLGNVPFAFIVGGVVLAHPLTDTLSGSVGQFWYGVPGAAGRIAIGLAAGMGSAAVFWGVALRGADVHSGAST